MLRSPAHCWIDRTGKTARSQRRQSCSAPRRAGTQARRLRPQERTPATALLRRGDRRTRRAAGPPQRRALPAHVALSAWRLNVAIEFADEPHRPPLRALPQVRIRPRVREAPLRVRARRRHVHAAANGAAVVVGVVVAAALRPAPVRPRLHDAQRTKLRSGKSGCPCSRGAVLGRRPDSTAWVRWNRSSVMMGSKSPRLSRTPYPGTSMMPA